MRLPSFREDISQLRDLFRITPWRMRPRVILLLIAALVIAAMDMVAVVAMLPLMEMLTGGERLPGVVQRFVVPLVGSDDRRVLLLVVTGVVGLLFLVKNVGLIVIRWLSIGVTQFATAAVQAELVRRYSGATYVEHMARSRAKILQVVSVAVPTAFSGVLLGYIAIAVDGITILFVFIALLVVSPLATLVAIGLFGGTALVVSLVLRPYALLFARRTVTLGTESWSFLNPAIEGFRDARIFQRAGLFTDGYARNRKENAKFEQRAAILGELPKYVLEIAMILGIFAIAALLFATSSEARAFGILAVFAAAAVRVIPSLNRLVATLNGVRAAKPSLAMCSEEIRSLPDADPERYVDLSGERFPLNDLVVKDLGFRYPSSHGAVLTDVQARIEAGSTTALVGSSGAGKTTFADIIAGLLPPTEGTVTVGGRDISENMGTWLNGIAAVSQSVYLWDATFRDLITFGQPLVEVDAKHLADVIDKAQLRDVVKGLPAGLDTRIGDGGVRLSGGQAQRIGIARALYARPRVLILDEATSALDNETEHQITRTIDALRGEATVIVIAHRLSTVKNADSILFFSGGRLVDSGTMTELEERVPEFARLVELGTLKR